MTFRYETEKDNTREATKNGNNLGRPISAIAWRVREIFHNIWMINVILIRLSDFCSHSRLVGDFLIEYYCDKRTVGAIS